MKMCYFSTEKLLIENGKTNQRVMKVPNLCRVARGVRNGQSPEAIGIALPFVSILSD